MTVLRRFLGLALVALAGAAGSAAWAQAGFPGDPLIRNAQTRARAASFVCEQELNAGGKSPACERFHAAMLEATALEGKRLLWCQAQVSSETSAMRVPDSCLGRGGVETRLEVIGALERKKAPAAWKKFDQAMTRLY